MGVEVVGLDIARDGMESGGGAGAREDEFITSIAFEWEQIEMDSVLPETIDRCSTGKVRRR